MSIETENRQAIKTSERYALLTGLLLLLLIVVTPFWALSHLEDDLTARSLRVLHEEIPDTSGITLRFSGRSAEIIGPLDDTPRLQHARQLVQNVWGVAGVATRAIEPPRPAVAAAGESQPSVEVVAAEPIAVPVATAQSASPITADLSGEGSPPPAPEALETPLSAASPLLSGAQVSASTTTATPDTAKPEPLEETPAATPILVATPGGTGPVPQAPAIEETSAEHSIPASPSPATETAPAHASVAAPASGPGEEVVPQAPPALPSVEEGTAELVQTPAPDATPPEPPKPEDEAADAHPRGLNRDDLLTDWPRLARVGHLQIEIDADSIRVSGEVDSLAERARIVNQAPTYLAANTLELNLSLVQRDAAQLAEYLNRLVIERFRFFGPGTRFAVGAELAMDRIAEVMNSYPDIRLGLVGFADPQTNPFARRTIARHRAAAAYHALLKRGVDARRLVMPDFPEPGSPIGAGYRPPRSHPNGQIQLFSLQGNYPWSTPPSK